MGKDTAETIRPRGELIGLRDKCSRDGERAVYRGGLEITFPKKCCESFQWVLIARQPLNPQETFEHQTIAGFPDIGYPYVSLAATGTPHQVIAAEVDAEESAHDASTISRSTG